MTDASVIRRAALLYGVQFAVLGIAAPFVPLWLNDRGLSTGAVGLVLAVPIVIRAASAYWVSGLADRRISALRLLGALSAVHASLWAAAAGFDALWVAVLVVVAAAVTTGPAIPLADTVAIDAAAGGTGRFGRIRLWGSIGFLAAVLGGGLAIEALGARAVPPLMFAAASAVALIAATSSGLGAPSEVRRRRSAKTAQAPLSRPFLWAGAGIACIQGSHAVVNGFGAILWSGGGHDPSVIGALIGTGVVAEILLFSRYGRVGKGAPLFAPLLAGGLLAALRWALMATEPGLAATFALQALHAVSFGATLLGTMTAVADLVPESERARAQGFVAGLTACVSACATAIVGSSVETLGAGVYGLMLPLALCGIAALLIARRTAQPQRAGDGGKTAPPE